MARFQKRDALHPIFWVSRNRKVVIMGIFLLLSAIIWLVNKLSYSYQSNMDVRLRVLTSNAGEAVADGTHQTLRCVVQARGYDFFWHKIFPFPQIEIDAAQYDSLQVSYVERRLPTYLFRSIIAETMGEEFEIIYLLADTLRYSIDLLAAKKVPVHPNVRVHCAPQYIERRKASVMPDSVTISGALKDVENLHYVATVPVEMKNVNRSTTQKIALLQPPHESLVLSTEYVNYSITVHRFGEVIQEIPIACTNKPIDVEVHLFPAKMDVSFLLDIQYSKMLHAAEPQLVVDYSDICKSMSGMAVVRIVGVPDYVVRTTMAQPFVRCVTTKIDKLAKNDG